MIEKMKMVHIVTSASKKNEMLDELRDFGLLHLADKKSADHGAIEKFALLSQTANTLAEYAPEKKEKGTKTVDVLSDDEFSEVYSEVLKAIERKAELSQQRSAAEAELERIRQWGSFVPSEIKDIKKDGYDFHFYRVDKKTYEEIISDPEIKSVRLSEIDKQQSIAVLGTLPPVFSASEFVLPEKGMEELEKIISGCEAEAESCNDILRKAAVHEESFKVQMLRAQNDEEYSSASQTAENDEEFVWITGYIPQDKETEFRETAVANKWAWALDDVSEDDQDVPTKLRYGKVSRLIKPVYDILGILPGYREQDVSIWFFLFFTLFFSMIIGDAGYGLLILAGVIAIHAKTKKAGDGIFLLYVLSIATIVWGAVTGTWFGMESAMKVPFLKALVIPQFANYPEYFSSYGVTAASQQNAIMKFSFSIGAIQMALGSILSIKKKIPEKNLSWLADLGWMMAVIAMYLLALFLVIGDNIPVKPVFALVAVAFIMVVLFGGMSPEKTFGQGLKSGLADAFTVFLNTISCFGNVMSYIRLFAVGMAGLAISQSFNGIAANFHGALMIFGVIVVVIGHALNIVMCFLSVVVHGVRLNVLEFSGQVGLEWTGFAYDPFKLNTKIKK